MKKKVEFGNMEVADANHEKDRIVSLEIGKCYQFKPEDFEVNVTNANYANTSFIQVMGQDVFIDFMALPGIKRDGKMVADATRIYMTHVQAKKLVDTLGAVLENTYQAGRMEKYPPKK
jgi:hypothetical protein